jgi:hypothetical protein
MPDEKPTGGSDHERVVFAVREQVRKIDEKAKKVALAPAS